MSCPPLKKPIIVCGVARSGTTFVRDLLHSHPDIAIADEFFLYRIPSLIPLFEELRALAGRRLSQEEWQARKAGMMRTLWFSVSQEARLQKQSAVRRIGCKTPGAEHFIDFYDDVFSLTAPLYVYVIREGYKVFVSRKNMEWGKVPTVQSQLKRYLQSIAAIEAFRHAAPERVHIIQLDALGNRYDERKVAVDALFRFVGESPSPEVEAFVHRWRPSQASAPRCRSAGRKPITSLSENERNILLSNSEYCDTMRRYGYLPTA